MGTLHVVGEDFQLRLGVDLGRLGQQERAVGLLRVGLLRLGRHEDLPVEHAVGLAVQDALVDLPAPAVGMVVEDGCVVVYQLLVAAEVEPVEQALHVGGVQVAAQVVPRNGPTHRKAEVAVVAVALLGYVRAPDVEGALALPLDPGVLHPGVLPDHHLTDGVGEVPLRVAQRHVAFDDRGPRLALHHHQVARVHHRVGGARCRHEQQVDRLRQVGTCRHMHERSIGDLAGVPRHERRRVHRDVPPQVFLQRGVAGPYQRQAFNTHAALDRHR